MTPSFTNFLEDCVAIGCNRERIATIRLDWLVVGGESGPGARPPHPDWFRSARDQCVAAGTPFFFKQWGEWAPALDAGRIIYREPLATVGDADMRRVGKRAAGAILDGREWREFPA